MENKHNTDIELESFFNRITTTSGIIIINICTYTVRYFSCVLYCCSEHIKYVRHWVGDDINVLLQNIQYKESDLIHREYLFLFNCNDAINSIDVFDDIKHFIGRLNKKSWELLAGINFYGGNVPQYMLHNRRYIETQFKLKTDIFCDDYEKLTDSKEYQKARMCCVSNCFYTSEELIEYMTRDSMRQLMWSASDPNCGFCNLLVVYDRPDIKRIDVSFNIFWRVVTYGLASTLISDNKLNWKDRFNSIASPWCSFLTRGLYDPRLLLLIADFMCWTKP